MVNYPKPTPPQVPNWAALDPNSPEWEDAAAQYQEAVERYGEELGLWNSRYGPAAHSGPRFQFGSPPQQGGFSFQLAPSQPQQTPQQPFFFGTLTAQQTSTSTPAIVLGTAPGQAQQTSTPAFSFGTASSPSFSAHPATQGRFAFAQRANGGKRPRSHPQPQDRGIGIEAQMEQYFLKFSQKLEDVTKQFFKEQTQAANKRPKTDTDVKVKVEKEKEPEGGGGDATATATTPTLTLMELKPAGANPFTPAGACCTSAQCGNLSITTTLPSGQISSTQSNNRVSVMIELGEEAATNGLRVEFDGERNSILLVSERGPRQDVPHTELRAPAGTPVDRLRVIRKGESTILITGTLEQNANPDN